jgi:ribonuclease R
MNHNMRAEKPELVEALARLLGDNVVMYTKAHGHHWNVTGRDFSQFHEFFQEIYEDVYLPKFEIKDAKHLDKVIVEVTRWGSDGKKAEGRVTKVLGKAGENDTEMHSILAEYGLPYDFPEEVEKAAASILVQIPATEIKKRKDMRKILTFTIDPIDAKDFDDAISYQKLKNGNTEIGVHIADVSHYVKPGSVLDIEAYKRATSVYLVDRVVPMLPEKLSNGLCSLRPNEDKLTFSAVFELDANDTIVKEWFGRTVIHSDRRFAYEQAQELIESSYASEIELPNCLWHIQGW